VQSEKNEASVDFSDKLTILRHIVSIQLSDDVLFGLVMNIKCPFGKAASLAYFINGNVVIPLGQDEFFRLLLPFRYPSTPTPITYVFLVSPSLKRAIEKQI